MLLARAVKWNKTIGDFVLIHLFLLQLFQYRISSVGVSQIRQSLTDLEVMFTLMEVNRNSGCAQCPAIKARWSIQFNEVHFYHGRATGSKRYFL